MRVLVCEHFTAQGHVNLFINICKLLVNSGFDVIAAVPQNFSKNIAFCNVEKMSLKYYTDEYPQKRSILTKTSYCLRVQKSLRPMYKKFNIDATFVVTYDEISLAIGRLMRYTTGPMFIIHNLNPDDIHVYKYRRFAYNLIKDKVFGITLAGYIKEFLVTDLHTDPNKIIVLPHPMNKTEVTTTQDIDCVGISNSNDEELIEKIIQIENRQGVIKQNNLKIILKSRTHSYDNGYLKIISGFIDNSLYDSYIARAKCILIPFPLSFKYRVSGTLIDALSNNKFVIGTDVHVIKSASQCYPNVIKRFDSVSFIKDIVEYSKKNIVDTEDFNRFQVAHSEEILSITLANAVKNAISKQPIEDTYDF